MQVCEGQRQNHHDQAAQGVEDLAPKLDFITLRGLPVVVQMADVLEQIKRRHAVRLEQRCGNHVGTDVGGPAPLWQFLVLYLGFIRRALVKDAALHIAQHPGGVVRTLHLSCCCTGLRGDLALLVKLKDAHVDQPAIGADGTHVDGEGVVVLARLEPRPGGTRTEFAQVAHLDQLGRFVGEWSQVVTHSKGQQHKEATQCEQRAQCQPGAHAAGAHDGEFRALRQARHHKNGADEHGDGQQLIQMAGNAERDKQQGMGQLVAV